MKDNAKHEQMINTSAESDRISLYWEILMNLFIAHESR